MRKPLPILAALLLAVVSARGEVRDHIVLVQSDGGVISIVDPEAGQVEASVRVGIRPQAVAVSPDGRLAVVTNDGAGQGGSSLAVVDLVQLRLTRTVKLQFESPLIPQRNGPLTFHRPAGLCFLADSQTALVTCPAEGALLVVDVPAGEVVGVIDTQGREPRHVVADPNGKRAFVSNSGTGTVSIVDVGRRRVVARFETGSGAAGIALHPSRNQIWVANSGSNSISVIDLASSKELAEFAAGSSPACLAFTEGGRYVVCSNREGSSLSIFHGESLKVVREIVLTPPGSRSPEAELARGEDLAAVSDLARGCRPVDLLLDPGGALLYVACTRSSYLAEVDARDWSLRRFLDVGPGPRGLVWWRSEDDWVSAK